MEEEDKIKQALLKKALGYSASEVVEEYTIDEEGEKRLSKKKVTKKHFSPDISAVKVLLERYYKTYEERVLFMNDDQLEEERQRLKQLLNEEEESGD